MRECHSCKRKNHLGRAPQYPIRPPTSGVPHETNHHHPHAYRDMGDSVPARRGVSPGHRGRPPYRRRALDRADVSRPGPGGTQADHAAHPRHGQRCRPRGIDRLQVAQEHGSGTGHGAGHHRPPRPLCPRGRPVQTFGDHPAPGDCRRAVRRTGQSAQAGGQARRQRASALCFHPLHGADGHAGRTGCPEPQPGCHQHQAGRVDETQPHQQRAVYRRRARLRPGIYRRRANHRHPRQRRRQEPPVPHRQGSFGSLLFDH